MIKKLNFGDKISLESMEPGKRKENVNVKLTTTSSHSTVNV